MHHGKRNSQIEKLNLENKLSLQERREKNKNKEVHEELKKVKKSLDNIAIADIEKNLMHTRQKYYYNSAKSLRRLH